MENFSSSESSRNPARRPAFAADRFDVIMVSAIVTLTVVIGLVIGHGNQLSARVGAGARVLYLGPIDALAENLWMVDPSTPNAAPVKLTSSQNGILDFDVAKDGSIVYSEQTVDGASNLMRYDMALGQSQLLYPCKDASCMDVALRPDGKMVAFDRSALNTGTNMPPGAPRIWLLDITTGQAAPLYPDPQQLGYTARWSADGTKLALFDSGSSVILVHDFTTGKDISIAALQGTVGTFSPDGKRLWFPKVVTAGQQEYATHMVIVDISTDPPTQHDLLPDTALDDDTDPIWSPDGQSLIIPRRAGDQPVGQDKQIYQVDIATGQAKPLVVAPQYAHSNLGLIRPARSLSFRVYC